MAMTNTIRSRSAEGRTQKVYGRLAFSGNYPANGEVVSPPFPVGQPKNILRWDVTSGNNLNAYAYDAANNKVIVRTLAGAEISAGAYPAGVTNDTVDYMVTYSKF